MKKADKENYHSFLTEEFKQAWEHYRHMENARSKYMNFFYTVLFGISGVSLTVLKDFDKKYLRIESLGVLTLLYSLDAFTIYIYSNVKKSGFILRHYEDVIGRVRMLVYEDPTIHNELMNVREKKHNVMKLKLFSLQCSAEYILTAFMYAIDVFILIIVLNVQEIFGFDILVTASFIFLLVFLFVFKTVLIIKGNKKPID